MTMSLLTPLRLQCPKYFSINHGKSCVARLAFCQKYGDKNFCTQMSKHMINSSLKSNKAPTLKMPLLTTTSTPELLTGFHSSPQNYFYEDRETKTLAVWQNLRELRASPLPALSLGLSGLIPFVAAPAYMISQGCYMPDIAFAQLAYGASILSFLGGVRWGFVLPEESVVQPNWVNLGYGVAPSLIAWTGLLMPPVAGMLTVITGHGFSAYMDISMYGYPPWFKGLRFLLSFFAILSLWSTFMCMMVMSSKNEMNSELQVDTLEKGS